MLTKMIKGTRVISDEGLMRVAQEAKKGFEEEYGDSEDGMFYRLDEDGNAQLFYDSGEVVTSMDANVYPVDSDLSVRYDHPGGVVLSVEDAESLGITSEYGHSERTAQDGTYEGLEQSCNVACCSLAGE